MRERVGEEVERQQPEPRGRQRREDQHPDALQEIGDHVEPATPDDVAEPTADEAQGDLEQPVGAGDEGCALQREANVLEVRNLVHDPADLRRRADRGGGPEQVEGRRAQRLGDRHPVAERACLLRGGRGCRSRSSVRAVAVRLRTVAQHHRERQPAANDHNGGDQQGRPPTERADQHRQHRHHEVAGAARGGEQPERLASLLVEPAHQRGRVRRRRAEALARGDHEAREVVDPEDAGLREEHEPDADDQHAGDRHPARSETVDERARDGGEQSVFEAAQREAHRDRGQTPAGLLADRLDEHTEAEADHTEGEEAGERAGKRDVPAVEQPAAYEVASTAQRGVHRASVRAPVLVARRCPQRSAWPPRPALRGEGLLCGRAWAR